jgi:4-hydroxy-tetrahydrodipicolinate synthase
MQPPPIHGVIAAMLTPRVPGAEPDLTALEKNIEFVLERDAAGVCIGGATGEYAGASFEDRRQLLARARAVAGDRGVLICAAGAASLQESLAIAADAEQHGADAVLLPPPHFFPYEPEDVEAFYREAAGCIRLPIVIYNLPAFTTGLAPELVVKLVEEEPNIIGVKDSSGSLTTLAALTGNSRARRIVGNDAVLEAALAAGCCDAVISGVAGVLPELVVAVFRGAEGGPLDEFVRRIDAFPTPWGLKLAAEIRGLFPAFFPLPLSEKRRAQMCAFRDWFPGWWDGTCLGVK